MKNTNQSLCRYIVFICVIVVLVAYAQSVYADEPCPTPNIATSSLKITKMPQGAVPGFFSVAANTKVVFAKGNLQWQGSTNTWRFASEQYETIGTATGSANMVFDTTLRKTSEDWIDLFPWASSGYGKAKPYFVHDEPISDYYVDGSYSKSMTETYANYDWGVYNPITNGGNAAGLWRTLTQAEWNYLINTRAKHDSLCTVGSIRNKENTAYIYGIFFFPDDFIYPEDFAMRFARYEAVRGDATTNRLTYNEWKQYEALGVIFLPAANYAQINNYKNGLSTNTNTYSYNYWYYWSASSYNYSTNNAYSCNTNIYITSSTSLPNNGTTYIYRICSVRLAKTLEQPVIE